LKSHGLAASISPPEGAYFMKPLISAMAAELAKGPPRVQAR
jgi:uroporphyrinogen-III synthase